MGTHRHHSGWRTAADTTWRWGLTANLTLQGTLECLGKCQTRCLLTIFSDLRHMSRMFAPAGLPPRALYNKFGARVVGPQLGLLQYVLKSGAYPCAPCQKPRRTVRTHGLRSLRHAQRRSECSVWQASALARLTGHICGTDACLHACVHAGYAHPFERSTIRHKTRSQSGPLSQQTTLPRMGRGRGIP